MPNGEKEAKQSECSLIAALRAGEPSAFAVLHERYLDRVFGYVVRRVPQREDAEDITCEVFAAAVQSLPTFRGESSLFGWLIGIARRKIADHLRHTRQRQEIREADLPPDQPSPFVEVDWTEDLPGDFLQREEVARAVRRAVAQLPDAQREVLLMRHVEGLSIHEVSHALGRSEDSVKALLRRAKATLLHALAPKVMASSLSLQRGVNHEQIPSAVQSVALESSPPHK